MYWDFVKSFFGRVDSLPRIPLALLGCGLARAWLWHMLDMVFTSPAFPSFSAAEGHFVFDAGEVVGFFLLAFLAYRASPYFRRPVVLAASLALMAGSAVFTAFEPANPGIAFEAVVMFGGGFGYSFALLLWLEAFGCLTARKVVMAWTGSYLFGFVAWAILFNGSSEVGAVASILVPFAMAFMLLRSFSIQPPSELPQPMTTKPVFPLKLAIVLSAFAFAFGIGDMMTGEVFSVPDKIGMGVPDLLILLGVVFFTGWFSYRHLITAASIMIAAATMMAFFVEDNTSLSVLLFNASAETYLVLSYTIGCNISHRLGVSSAYICGLLAGFYKVFLQVGKVLSAALLTASPTVQIHHAIVGTAIVLLTVAASIVLVQDRDIVERFNFKQLSIDPANATYKSLSERYALTPKEASVFMLLAKGDDAAEIAEKMFLAPSTVRVHISGIYKKLGIHSKRELKRYLQDIVQP